MTIALKAFNVAVAPNPDTTITVGSLDASSLPPASGDLLVAVFRAPLGGLTVTLPLGWTHLPNDLAGKQIVLYRICGGAEPGSYTFTLNQPSPAGNEIDVWLSGWSGADPTTPIPSSFETADLTTGAPTAATPQLTTVRDGSLYLGAVLSEGLILSTPPDMVMVYSSPGKAMGVVPTPTRETVGPETFNLTGNPAGGFSGPFYQSAGAALVMQPPPAAPYAPVLDQPTSGKYVDLAAGASFSWVFSDPDGGDTQAGYQFRRKASVGGSYEYWKASTSSWQPTPFTNTSTTPGVTFPAGAWGNGAAYLWSVATQDQNGMLGSFAGDRPVVGSTAPVVDVTHPTGTVTTTTAPLVQWTFTDSDGDPESSWRARIFTDTQHSDPSFDPDLTTPVADSGLTLTAATSWQAPDLDNSTGYWAYVKASQPGGQSSGWASEAFTINVVPPAVPTSLTVTPDPTNARVLIEVSGATGTQHVVERSDDGGDTWTTVRNAEAIDVDGSGDSAVYDYEAPLNIEVQYRAKAISA